MPNLSTNKSSNWLFSFENSFINHCVYFRGAVLPAQIPESVKSATLVDYIFGINNQRNETIFHKFIGSLVAMEFKRFSDPRYSIRPYLLNSPEKELRVKIKEKFKADLNDKHKRNSVHNHFRLFFHVATYRKSQQILNLKDFRLLLSISKFSRDSALR